MESLVKLPSRQLPNRLSLPLAAGEGVGVSQLTRAVSQKSVVERGVLLVIGVRFLFARKAVLPAVRGMDKSGISASRWRRGQVGPQQHTVSLCSRDSVGGGDRQLYTLPFCYSWLKMSLSRTWPSTL